MSKGVEIPARIPIRRHGVARVEAILEAATKLFAERGLQGTTMSAHASRQMHSKKYSHCQDRQTQQAKPA